MLLLARRLLGAAILLWIVLSLTFVLLHSAPGDPATLLVPPAASAAELARARAAYGLDRPLVVQYARWAGDVLTGNLGESFVAHRPVTAVLAEALPVSIGLGIASLVLSFVLGIAVGTFQAVRRGRPADTALTIAAASLYAAPSYWLALALIALFTSGAAKWGFPAPLRLPAFGMHDPAGTERGLAAGADLARHAILPLVTLTAIGAAGIARYTRTIVADVLAMPFVRTARAKGLGAFGAYGWHALANALPPLVILFALAFPGVLAGSVFVETVFAWPGLGRLMVTSILQRDYPVVLGATLLYAAIVILSNLAGDLLLPVLDPRRRA